MTEEQRQKLKQLSDAGKYARTQRVAYGERLEVERGLGFKIEKWEEYNVKFDPLKDRYKGQNVRKYIATTSREKDQYVVYEVEVYSDLKLGDLTLYKMIQQHAREQALIKSPTVRYHTQIDKEILFLDDHRVYKYVTCKRYQQNLESTVYSFLPYAEHRLTSTLTVWIVLQTIFALSNLHNRGIGLGGQVSPDIVMVSSDEGVKLSIPAFAVQRIDIDRQTYKDDDLLFRLNGFLEGYELSALMPELKGKGNDRKLSRRQMMMLDKEALCKTLDILFK